MIGDLFADLASVASATQSYQQGGSLGLWLANQLAEFRKLPGSLNTVASQIARVQPIVAGTLAVQNLHDAAALVQAAERDYPDVSTRVNQLTAAIAPVMPKLYAGTYDSEVITALLSSGVDIAVTAHHMNALIQKRDDAQRLVQDAVSDPSLPSSTRDAALAALGSVGSSTWMKVGVGLVIGYVVIKAVMK